MRKLTILAMCIVAMACSKTEDRIDLVDIDNLNTENIGNFVSAKELDKEAIAELITTKALVIDKIFRYLERDNKWHDYTYVPGNTTIHGITFDGNESTIIHACANIPGEVCEGPQEEKSVARYDAETCTLYFQSHYYDYEYSATVIYYDGEKILFHGVLPISDGVSTNYPDANLHRYVCRFSEESAQEWIDKVLAELEEEHQYCRGEKAE